MTYRKHDISCSFKQFRLLNCLGDKSTEDECGLKNVKHGFTLEPGESVSLFIELFPDCKRPRDFVGLNFERRRKTNLLTARGRFGLLPSPGDGRSTQHSAKRDSNNYFSRRKFELLIGYEMSDEDYKSSVPLPRWGLKMRHVERSARCLATKGCKKPLAYMRLQWYGVIVFRFMVFSGCIVFSYAILCRSYLHRRNSSAFLCFEFNMSTKNV